jgi:hypothetical protein
MPNDGGVDVISGACAPAPPPPKAPKKKPKKLQQSIGEGFEDCTSERILQVRPGTCSWFLIQIRKKRLTPRDRKRLGSQLQKLVQTYIRSVPVHVEN